MFTPCGIAQYRMPKIQNDTMRVRDFKGPGRFKGNNLLWKRYNDNERVADRRE